MRRLVSLLPAATEIACALGLEAELVGRSHECDFPAAVRSLPACTAPAFACKGSSAQIHARMQELWRAGRAAYRVERQVLAALRPQAILTQVQCEVCAVDLREVEQAVADWPERRPRLITLQAASLDGLWADIQRVGTALDLNRRATVLIADLRRRMQEIATTTRRRRLPTLACIEWIEPLMAAGNWVPELATLAGASYLFGQSGTHSSWLAWEALQAADPEVIVIMPCGLDLARARADARLLTERPGWGKLRASGTRRVYVTDGNQYFNRPGPRLAESLEILAEILYPQDFHFGHEGRGWQRL